MATNVKFVFLASTVIAIFATGAVLMSLISTGTKAVNVDVSETASHFSGIFLIATFLFAILSATLGVLVRGARNGF